MILSLDAITKGFADRLLLERVSLSVEARDRIGLVGANGAGKTTLLNLLCGRLDADAGEVYVQSGLSIGYLEQGSGLQTERTILEEMRSVFAPLLKAQARMRELETAITPENSEEYARLSAYFEQNNGYGIEVEIRTVLNGMGFLNRQFDTPIHTLSGGEKTRLALAKLLLTAPQLLVLDEPTNHLDFKTLDWLEGYLRDYKGALIVVSHDRYFLDRMVEQIWELSAAQVNVYKGNYTKYKRLKAERTARQQKEYEQTRARAAALSDYAQKNMARASTAASAKSRLKQLARLEPAQKPLPPVRPPRFAFPFDRDPVKEVLTVEHLRLTVGEAEKCLLEDLSFTVRRGEKIAIIGDNGVGKSTLLKALRRAAEQPSPAIRWGKNATLSYFDQEGADLIPTNTVLEELHRRHPTAPEREIRARLGGVRITEDNVFKPVSVISGGERAKLGLAVVMAARANTMLLDEPTNHLDLESKEALEAALCAFTGTLLFITHDRYFLNAVPDRILELRADGATVYDGGYDAYLQQKQTARPDPPAKPRAAHKPESGYKSKAVRSEQAKRRDRLRRLEGQIAEQEAQIHALEREIADPQIAADYARLQELCNTLEALKTAQEQTMEEWVELSD